MTTEPAALVFGNALDASKHTRGWFLAHFMPADNPLQTEDVELKWYTHAKGETRDHPPPKCSSGCGLVAASTPTAKPSHTTQVGKKAVCRAARHVAPTKRDLGFRQAQSARRSRLLLAQT
jgi:hypothetical protein